MAKRKVGRKGKYQEWLTEEGLIKVEGWARDGLADEQIAHNMGIAYSTLRKWRDEYSAISAALKRGKEVVDRQIENALYKSAMGFPFDEVTYEDGMEVKRVTKLVPPSTTAQIFWLKNRKPVEWRDKQDIEHSGAMSVSNPFADLTTEELRKLARINE